MVKNLPTMQKTWALSLGWEDPLEKGMTTHFSTLAWKFLWTEEPGGLQSMGWQRVGRDWVTNAFTAHWPAPLLQGFPVVLENQPTNAGSMRCGFDPWVGKIPWRRAWQHTPSCLENPMDRGGWWATVHRVAESQIHDWSNLACTHTRAESRGTCLPQSCPTSGPFARVQQDLGGSPICPQDGCLLNAQGTPASRKLLISPEAPGASVPSPKPSVSLFFMASRTSIWWPKRSPNCYNTMGISVNSACFCSRDSHLSDSASVLDPAKNVYRIYKAGPIFLFIFWNILKFETHLFPKFSLKL